MGEKNNHSVEKVVASVAMPRAMATAIDEFAWAQLPSPASRAAIIREAVSRYLLHEGAISQKDVEEWRARMSTRLPKRLHGGLDE